MIVFQRINNKIKGFVLVLCLTSMSMQASSSAVIGAIEPTALLSNFELIDIAIKDAQQLATSIRQYEIMAQNLQGLPDYVKQQAFADLTKLSEIVQTGNAISYSSAQFDDDYRGQHRDFDYYVQMQQGSDYETDSAHYQNWSSTNQDTIRGALRAANLQSSQFLTESTTLRTIENQASSATGQMQVMQAGAAISAQQVEQLQKLRQLIMAQMQMQGAYSASQIDRQTQKDAVIHKRNKTVITFDPDKVPPPLTADDLFN